MACRVGMTPDENEREVAWRRVFPTLKNWTVLEAGLTYEEACEKEAIYAERFGCEHHCLGRSVPGRTYIIYRFEY